MSTGVPVGVADERRAEPWEVCHGGPRVVTATVKDTAEGNGGPVDEASDVSVNQWESVRDNLRKAYESGLDSVRQARAEARAAEQEEDDLGALIPVPPVLV